LKQIGVIDTKLAAQEKTHTDDKTAQDKSVAAIQVTDTAQQTAIDATDAGLKLVKAAVTANKVTTD
jgi:hypothetical protein